jgi:hypothetical protein
MSLRHRKKGLADERFRLLIKYVRLTTLHATAPPPAQNNYDLMLRHLERQLQAIEFRLEMIEVNVGGAD